MASEKKKKQGSSDPDRMALVINSAISQGLEIVSASWANRPSKRGSANEVRELEKVHKAALARHTQEVSSHRRRLRRAQKRVSSMTTTAAVTGALTVISGVSTAGEGVSPATAMLAAVTGAAALIAYRSREVVQHPPPEPTAILPAPPPPPLRSGARGDSEASRLLRIRSQLVSLIPAVSHLHPEAGVELARADTFGSTCVNRGLIDNRNDPYPPSPYPRTKTESCSVSRLDPAGMFIQSYNETETGPIDSDVRGQACREALDECSREIRGRQTCNIAR